VNQWWQIELCFGVYVGRNLHHLRTFVSLSLTSLADVHSCERYHDEAFFFNYLFPAIATMVQCSLIHKSNVNKK